MRRVLFLTVLLISAVGVGASLALLPPGGSFSDDNGNTHEGYIEAIAAEGITEGCGTSLYCPGDEVTRGQMASFLARALQLPQATRDWFPDDAGLVHEENINRIADAAITTGFSDRTFRPSEPVRRDQMASFLARALQLPQSTRDWFPDDAGLVHEDNINRVAQAGITQGCATGSYCPSQNVRRDQMASFLGRALGLTPIIPPPPAGTLFSGPLQSVPGLSGEISFEVAPNNATVKNPALDLVLTNYQCDGVTLSGNGRSTIFTTVAVVNGSFSFQGGGLTWNGTFVSSTRASGTVSGTTLLGTVCDWGPISWTANSTGQPPPTSSTTSTSATSTSATSTSTTSTSTTSTSTTSTSTTSTSTTSTTTTTLPSGGWPPCDFTSFSIAGSGPAVVPLEVPGDKPAILDITYTGTYSFFVDTLDSAQAVIDPIVVDGGGGYAGIRPVNQHTIYADMRYVYVDTMVGPWTIEVRPVCTARSLSGTSIAGAGDEVVIVNRGGTATMTHAGSSNFIVWAHQSYTGMDLEVNEIGPFTGQVEIDPSTIFLDVFTGLEPGPWTITFQ